QNGEQFVRLLRATAPEGKSHVLLVRAGKEVRVRVRLAAPVGMSTPARLLPKALIKPGGPPAISVKPEPLDGGKLQVTFLRGSDAHHRPRQSACAVRFYHSDRLLSPRKSLDRRRKKI